MPLKSGLTVVAEELHQTAEELREWMWELEVEAHKAQRAIRRLAWTLAISGVVVAVLVLVKLSTL